MSLWLLRAILSRNMSVWHFQYGVPGAAWEEKALHIFPAPWHGRGLGSRTWLSVICAVILYRFIRQEKQAQFLPRQLMAVEKAAWPPIGEEA